MILNHGDAHREPPSTPPEEKLTPLLIARQTLPCAWQQCATSIVDGEPVYLLDVGWVHALHLDGE